MKTLISYVAVSAFILMSSFTIDVQQHLNQKSPSGCFSYFRAHRQGHAAITMNWAVTSTDVVAFEIERTYDEYFYENLGTVSFNGAAAYKFTDQSPYPGKGLYRIIAIKEDGSREASPFEEVRIVRH